MPSTRRSNGHNQLNSLAPATAQSESASLSTSPPSSSKPSDNRQSFHPLPQPANPLHQQWEFAALWEFLFQFHQGLKSPYYEDIEDFARDLSSSSGTPLLHDVQIGLLKNVSSQRGLTIEMFDDYTRRQYINRRAPINPFGTDPLPISFYSLEPEERVRVLHQLAMWIISNTDSFRSKIDPHKVMDHTDWRIDPIGWDSKGTTYYQFDNGYLYCRTEPLPPVYQKWKSRKSTGSRSAKRRKVTTEEEPEPEPEPIAFPADENDVFVSQIEWKCLCSNLQEYRALVARFEKSKHPDEKELRKVIVEDILPTFEKEEQKRKKKLLEEEKELARLELLSGRKRSARVDERMAKRREVEEREQALRREQEEHDRQEQEETKRRKDEEARVAKLEERERRLQEREMRAKQREEERARLLDPDATESEDNEKSRKSFRQKEKRKAELDMEDKDWVFDCICGVNGINYDDGTYSIACDKCGVWQHTACLKLPQSTAEENDFVCDRCRDKAKAASSPPIKIKLRLTARPPSSDAEGDDTKQKLLPPSPSPVITTLSNNNATNEKLESQKVPCLPETSITSSPRPTNMTPQNQRHTNKPIRISIKQLLPRTQDPEGANQAGNTHQANPTSPVHPPPQASQLPATLPTPSNPNFS